MLQCISPVRFAAQIKMVGVADFNDRFKALQADEITEHACIRRDLPRMKVSVKDQGGTKKAYDCGVLGIYTKKGSLFHLLPPLVTCNIPYLKSLLDDELAKLKQEGGDTKVSALVTGGKAYEDHDRYRDSVGTFQVLREWLASHKIENVSKIWGRRSPQYNHQTDMLFDAPKDTWYIRVVGLKSGHKEHDILTWDELAKAFEVIELAPADTLILGNGETLTPLDVKHRLDKRPSPFVHRIPVAELMGFLKPADTI